MVIRPRRDDDIDPLVTVGLRVRDVDHYPVHLPAGGYRSFLATPVPLDAWVAEVDGHLVGHVALIPSAGRAVTALLRRAGIDGDLGVVARLMVDPRHRRTGIARHLLRTARDRALELGLVPVLDVVASSASAVALYVTDGWIEIGPSSFTTPEGRVVDELVFAWHAPPAG